MKVFKEFEYFGTCSGKTQLLANGHRSKIGLWLNGKYSHWYKAKRSCRDKNYKLTAYRYMYEEKI